MENIGIVVVDVQGDFTQLRNGSLAVEQTDQSYLYSVDKAVLGFKERGYKIFATQDWHPEDHISFFTNTPGKQPFEILEIDGRSQVLWPPHCVQNSDNARLLLDENLFTEIIQKGTNKSYDSYSGFQDDGGIDTGMDKILKANNIEKLVVFGLATDYCVKATVLDARKKGYKVVVIESLCKGVAPESTKEALKEMESVGAVLTNESDPQLIAGLF